MKAQLNTSSRNKCLYKCVLFNARSVCNKLPDIHSFIAINSPDIIIFVESWLHSKFPSCDLSAGLPYHVLRNDRDSKGGGVAVLVRDNFSFILQNYKNKTKSNSVCFDLVSPDGLSKIRFIAVYVPPSLTKAENSDVLDLLAEMSAVPYDSVILGDLNYHVDWVNLVPSNYAARDFLNLFFALNLRQHVTSPTRGNNILDLVMTSQNCHVVDTHVIPALSTSDHSGVLFKFLFNNILNIIAPKPDFVHADYDKIKQELSTLDWFALFDGYNDIDDLYRIFCTTLFSVFEHTVPIKRTASPLESYPTYIRSLANFRSRLFKNLSSINRKSFDLVTIKLAKLVRKYNYNREKNMYCKLRNAFLYQHIKSKSRTVSKIPSLLGKDGNLLVSSIHKANAIAEHFASIYQTDNGVMPVLNGWSGNTLSELTFLPHEVENFILKLKPSLSLTVDGFPQYFVKKCAKCLATPISIICNVSLSEGRIPDIWKLSYVTPIPKVNPPKTIKDFRPISITSAISKVLEKLIREHIYRWSVLNSVLPHEQFGFVKNKNTELQLLEAQYHIDNASVSKTFVDTIYFDLAKAFDSVIHEKLKAKLASIGIKGNLLSWIESFLSRRKFRVCVDDYFSDWHDSTSGVPQGSVLGPLLFILYVYDLPRIIAAIPQVRLQMYADDIKLCLNFGPSTYYFRAQLQKAIYNFETYCNLWQLNIAKEKCFFFKVGSSPDLSYLFSSGEAIAFMPEVRDLGVFFKTKSSIPFHDLQPIIQKSFCKTFSVFRVITYCDAKLFVRAFLVYVIPYVDYCSSVWSPYKLKHIRAIEKIQKVFTRVVFGKCFSSSGYKNYEERLKILELRTLHERRVAKDLKLFYKMLHGEFNFRFGDYFTHAVSRSRENIYNRNGFCFVLKNTKLKSHEYTFYQRVVRWYPKLPKYIVESKSSHLFANHLKQINLFNVLGLDRPIY